MRQILSALSGSRAWDLTTRMIGAGCFSFLAAASLAAAVATARRLDAGTMETGALAALLAQGSIFLLLLVETVLIAGRPRAIAKAPGFQARASAFLGTWLMALVVLLPVRTDLPASSYAIAATLGALGDLLAVWVVLHLRGSFSVMAEARRMVVHGPYALVRHPLYLAEEIGLASAVISHLSPAAITLLAVQVFFQLLRCRNEERVLATTFPAYAEYMRRTPMLLPRLRLGRGSAAA